MTGHPREPWHLDRRVPIARPDLIAAVIGDDVVAALAVLGLVRVDPWPAGS